MKIKEKIAFVYDVEVFKNVFHCTVYNTESNELHKYECSIRKNNLDEMCELFLNSDAYFVGYNNIHYDNPILNYIIMLYREHYFDRYSTRELTESVFRMSQLVIDKNSDFEVWKEYKYARNFLSIDLLTMLYSKALRVSLKEMQITMEYDNVQEFMADWDSDLDINKIDILIDYNINDVMSTDKLLNICEKDLMLRIDIEKEYNMECLSKDGVGIGAELLKRKYLEATGLSWYDIKDLSSPMDMIPLNDVILPKINYDSPILKNLISKLRSMTVSPGRKGLEEQFIFGGVKISIGVGGIHSVNTPGIIKPADDELLLDVDAEKCNVVTP